MPLPVPVARQREVVCLPATGHQVVLGTAGSGKTTMAILRAAQLSDAEMPGSGPTLLLTFNKPLGAYIKAIAGTELKGVQVENYHKFARGYLNARGLMNHGDVLTGWRHLNLIQSAVLETTQGAGLLAKRPRSFFEEEIRWLARHGISSAEDYARIDRVGRAQARMERELRPEMWNIYEKYRQLRADAGFRYDWDDMATQVASALSQDTSDRKYRHIVIDEGQDLSPEMLRSLSLAVPANGSITFFGDVAQQIYGHRMSWRSAGLSPRQVWNFAHNYRNSREIANLGLAIAQMPYYAGVPDMVQPDPPTAAGPKPTVVKFADPAHEIPFVIDQATRIGATQNIAILARTNAQVERVRSAFKKRPVDLRDDAVKWAFGPRIVVGTYHSAKGLEFDAVILPFLSAGEFPDPELVDGFGAEEARANDGRLLYVGVTRAKRSLIMTYSGRSTDMLPADGDLVTSVSR